MNTLRCLLALTSSRQRGGTVSRKARSWLPFHAKRLSLHVLRLVHGAKLHLRAVHPLLAGVLFIGCLGPLSARAELILLDKTTAPQEFVHEHPFLRFLVFATPEARGQAILPPAPVFVPPPPLLWRAPVAMPPYPPATPLAFNRSGAPSNRDLAIYQLGRAHAMGQNLYRAPTGAFLYDPVTLWWAPAPSPYGWAFSSYPPPAPGSTHPSNRDNASYLIERAHRFSQDAYRKP